MGRDAARISPIRSSRSSGRTGSPPRACASSGGRARRATTPGRRHDVDAGQPGSAEDPEYFRKFVEDERKRPAKVYWVSPGEEAGEVARAVVLERGEVYPPAVEMYLAARPMVDRTERYGEVTDLEVAKVPAGKTRLTTNGGEDSTGRATTAPGQGRVFFLAKEGWQSCEHDPSALEVWIAPGRG